MLVFNYYDFSGAHQIDNYMVVLIIGNLNLLVTRFIIIQSK